MFITSSPRKRGSHHQIPAFAGMTIILFLVLFLFTSSASAQTTKFLVTSDIHINPFHTCKNETPCPIIEKLRATDASNWGKIFSEFDTNAAEFGKDTNFTLYQDTLTELKNRAQTENVNFILILGDFFPHHFKKYFEKYSADKSQAAFESFARKTLEFMTFDLKEKFPSISIYHVAGNNDGYGDDYEVTPYGAFFQDSAEIWSQLIKDELNHKIAKAIFKKAGYYAITLAEEKSLRLIVLNSNLFSQYAKGVGVNAAANKELNWLHNELISAHVKKQKVIIAEHIADGVDIYASLKQNPFAVVQMWKPEYSQRFRIELEQSADDILGVFAGHTHSDWFQVLGMNGNEFLVTGVPSISPVIGNNPAYKIFEYVPNNLINYKTYYYSLGETNRWSEEYNFNEVYQPNCSECKLIDGMKLLQAESDLAESYKKFYAVSRNTQPITKSNKWVPYYWCTIHNVSSEEYLKCLQ